MVDAIHPKIRRLRGKNHGYFLWIEDRKGKASYTFWENLMKQLCPDVIIESKKNNSE